VTQRRDNRRKVDESERNRLVRKRTALVLAVSDMRQAAAAARTLVTEDDRDMARVLETGMVVSYMRPFTGRPPGRLPEAYVPQAAAGAEYHAELKDLRDRLHAHTDEESGRVVSVLSAVREGDVVSVQWHEQGPAISPEELPGLIEHFERLRDRFGSEAPSIHVQLHGLGSVGDA